MNSQHFVQADQTVQADAFVEHDAAAGCRTSGAKAFASGKVAIANTALVWGMQHYQRRKFDRALKHFQTALRLYTQAQNVVGMGKGLNGLSAVYLALQEYPRSLAYSQAAVCILEATEADADYALALYQLGVSHLSLHNRAQAEDPLNRALSLYIRLGDTHYEDYAVLRLGQLYAQNKEFMFALAAYESVLDSLLARPFDEATSTLLDNLLSLITDLCKATNQDHIAIAPYQTAMMHPNAIDDPKAVAPIFHRLGHFYEVQHRYGLAAACHAQALQIGTELPTH